MTHLNRRTLLAALPALALASRPVFAAPLEAVELGLVPDLEADQSAALQSAIDTATRDGRPLQLPAGRIHVRDLVFPDSMILQGVRGRSSLATWQDGIIGSASAADTLTFEDVVFEGGTTAMPGERALLEFATASGSLYRCSFRNGAGSGVTATESSFVIDDCDFAALGDAGIHAMDSRTGMTIRSCRIRDCGNAGIRIWRSVAGADGSIVTGNRIAAIDWRGGGNGQNGNGINIFLADEVIVADNHIADCAFTAVRLNSTNNCQVTGNICLNSGEVAIFSEFDFSGSVIANNIIDGAATGISVTNFDQDGQLAVVSGNIVRNIAPRSAVNPDTIPIGIFAEAHTAITGNTVQNVPGVAIAAGYGEFLRNVLISANVISGSDIGIGVSVAEGAGSVHIADNMIHEPRQYAAVGLAWTEVVEPDLLANAGRFPNVSIGGTVASPG